MVAACFEFATSFALLVPLDVGNELSEAGCEGCLCWCFLCGDWPSFCSCHTCSHMQYGTMHNDGHEPVNIVHVRGLLEAAQAKHKDIEDHLTDLKAQLDSTVTVYRRFVDMIPWVKVSLRGFGIKGTAVHGLLRKTGRGYLPLAV